jgi:hypothetical protein
LERVVKDYVAEHNPYYRYPGAGDKPPPGGAKVLLLTKGGVCVTGSWNDSGAFIAWSPMPKRDREKEACMRDEAYLMEGDCEA